MGEEVMEELIQSIYNNPEDWTAREYAFTHKSGFEFWVANGFFFMSPYGSGGRLNFLQQIRAWRAYKWWCANAPISAFK